MNNPPEISGTLRKFMLKVPPIISEASGIRIMGKLIKSVVFTTDICKIGRASCRERV